MNLLHSYIDKILDIGIALSSETESDKLFEKALDAAMEITNCDCGMLYIPDDDDNLCITMVISKSENVREGVDNEIVDLPFVPRSMNNVCSRAAITKTPINIPEINEDVMRDYPGGKMYTELTGYNAKSLLAVPMMNNRGDVVGVMQLLNALDENGEYTYFTRESERIVFSLASQAATFLAMRNYAFEVERLLRSFTRVIVTAIDARSPYNANHTRNMARYADRFIAYLNETGEETFSATRKDQFIMAVWLHDIGKLVIPREVMDKQNRLGAGLEAVLQKFRIIEMQAEIDFLRKKIEKDEYAQMLSEIDQLRKLVKDVNYASVLSDEKFDLLQEYGEKTVRGPGGEEPLLKPEELACLLVRKGTLTDDERQVMENHVVMTRLLLEEMNLPKKFRGVLLWAGSHHELLDGKGYPDGLSGAAIPLETRMLTILDIFDALTARDRPYKSPMSDERAFETLTEMAEQGQIDTRLLKLFYDSEAWKDKS